MNPFTRAGSAGAAVLLAAVTAVMGLYALSLTTDPGVESLIPARGRDADITREFARRFGSDEVIVVALSADPLFTRERLEAIDDLTRRAARLPHVARVISPTNLKDLDGDELGPVETTPYETVAAGAMAPGQLGLRLAKHPLFGGLLVSADGRTAALLIEIEPGADHRAETVAAVRELAASAPSRGPGGLTTWVAGLPVEKADVAAYIERDQRTFAPILVVMLAVIMAALYRHAVAVVVPLAVVGVSLLWTLGIYSMAGRSLNPITSLLTPVVLVVSVEGAVHILNHHLAARASGLGRPEALKRAVRLSFTPCFTASFTTAIGFASLALLPIPAMRDFGLFTAVGVMISWVLTVTLAPLLLVWLPDFPPRVTRAFHPGPVERMLRRVAGAVCRRPATAALLSLLVLAAGAAGLARIRVETDLIGSLRRGSPLREATSFINDHLTGVNSMEILVRGVSPVDPAGLARVDALERAVRSMEGVRQVTGLPDLYARANRAFHLGDEAFAALPSGEDAAADLADCLDMLRQRAPADLRRFVSTEPDDVLRVTARVNAMGTASSQQLFHRVRAAAVASGLTGVDLTGSFVVLSDMSTNLVYNQIGGLVPALALILLAMAIQFRSARLGLLCIIPNGAPVLMVYGVMGWAGIALSVPTAMIASIAIGMTDDNTIHLLARFRRDFREGGDYVKALDTMMNTSGRAMVYSTLTLTAGFWVGAFSAFLPTVHFAVLTGAALLLSLVSEAVLLPLTLILFKPLGRPRSPSSGRAATAALLLACALVVAGATTAAAASAPNVILPNVILPNVILKDQFGKTGGPSLHKGKMVVLIYGQPSGLRRMKSWELKLRENGAPAHDVVRAVDARGVKGRKTPDEVNARLREGVPPDINILIDWNGDLVSAYGLPAAEVAVAVIDPEGRACGSASGPVKDDTLRGVLDTMSRVQKRGSCP